MTYLFAIVLGLIQGLTEFLPVSSSGHLTLCEIAFGMSSGNVLYNVLLHVATLLALVVIMRKQVWQVFSHPLEKPMRLLLLSTIITGLVGLGVDHFVGASGNLLMVSIGFVVTGICLLSLHFFVKSKKYQPKPLTYKHAIVVGAMQGVAVLPGLSRSGSTLCAGVFSGADTKGSAEFSFLLSIPIILIGMTYEIYKGLKGGFEIAKQELGPALVGFVVAFLSAIMSIKFMMRLVSKNRWLGFSIYLFLSAIVIIVVGICHKILI